MIVIDPHLVVTGRTEAVLEVVELIGKGGQSSKMTHSKNGQQQSRPTKEHLTDQCVTVSPLVHLGTSVQAFVAGHVDSTEEDLASDRKGQGLMNIHRSGPSMVAIMHLAAVDFVDGVVTAQVSVTVQVLENAMKERMPMMAMRKTVKVLMTNKEGKHHFSQENEEVSVNRKSGKDLRKLQSDLDLMTEEVAGSLFVVAEVADVDLVEVGEVLTDLERGTMSDILKGMFVC